MLSFRFGMEDITLWRKLWKIVKLLIQPFGWLFPNELAVMFEWWLLDDRWDPWAFAVTDSRILVRHSLFRRRYLDMRLAEIVDIHHDASRRRLVFVANDAAAQLTCRDESGSNILNAVDYVRTEVRTA